MHANTIGKAFSLTTFGSSHGPAVGGIIDGCPAGLEVDLEAIARQMARRRPGQSALSTSRDEADQIEWLSGIFEGKTDGTPIGFIIQNRDVRSEDYDHLKDTFRPGHADYTYAKKYGHRDHRGGGRASARATAVWVAAGALAQQLLEKEGVKIHAYVSQVGEVVAELDPSNAKFVQIDQNLVRCPDFEKASEMEALIARVKDEGDTVGGRISCCIKGAPIGLGEPLFDKLHADLAKAMMSINAAKGFEIGSGFSAAAMRGSQHNDQLEHKDGKVKQKTNNAGGVLGGVSTGADIVFNVAFKPVSTLMQDQPSVDTEGNKVVIEGKGRHDPCVVPRAVPIVEAMSALVLADHLLRNRLSKL